MDKKYEIFSNWWHASEQEELRKYCATGWGWKIWQAVTELQNGQQNIPGWKLVPVEITQEMVDANFEGVCTGGIQAGYRAILAAAPEVNSGKTD